MLPPAVTMILMYLTAPCLPLGQTACHTACFAHEDLLQDVEPAQHAEEGDLVDEIRIVVQIVQEVLVHCVQQVAEVIPTRFLRGRSDFLGHPKALYSSLRR